MTNDERTRIVEDEEGAAIAVVNILSSLHLIVLEALEELHAKGHIDSSANSVAREIYGMNEHLAHIGDVYNMLHDMAKGGYVHMTSHGKVSYFSLTELGAHELADDYVLAWGMEIWEDAPPTQLREESTT